MNQEKFGKFIKEVRKKNNLTQKEFADKYNVTYQAVSKWENGKNLPDISLMMQISKDFGMTLDEIYDGKYNDSKKKQFIILLVVLGIILTLAIFFTIFSHDDDFKFKTLSSTCKDFNISGNIAYNDKKSAIYISNIEYCGGNDKFEYKRIECVLYEKYHDIDRKIKSYSYTSKSGIKLEDYFKNLTLTMDNFSKICKNYKDGSLYLSINATTKDNKTITYQIPLKLESECNFK